MDPIAAYLQPLVDNHTLAGAVVVVADKDRILYNKGVGFRDIAAQAPMAADDMFWIASTTKPMTATALMMLVDEGKVSVDAPVEMTSSTTATRRPRTSSARTGSIRRVCWLSVVMDRTGSTKDSPRWILGVLWRMT